MLGLTRTMVVVQGFKMIVDVGDRWGVGRKIYVQREYDPVETSYLMQVLKPGMLFLDIGANIGYFTLLAASAVGPEGRVIAVEPEPKNYRVLTKNLALNGIKNALPRNVALGSSCGSAALYLNEQNWGDHRLWGNSPDVAGGDRSEFPWKPWAGSSLERTSINI